MLHSASMLLLSHSALLFGVSVAFYDASVFNVACETSFVQSIVLRSEMNVMSGNLYVREANVVCVFVCF